MPSFLPALAELEGRDHRVGGSIPPISSLFEGLANLAVEVSPGAGDYIAGKRALEAYGNMGEMMQQGQYMDAASYGAQGLTEQISTIPALGEIATGAKMFAAGVGALKGFPNARPDWIHGSPESGIDKLNEPVFLTKDPEGANYFSELQSSDPRTGRTIYPYRYEPANALDLDTLEGSKELLRISEDLGINTGLYDYTNLKKITPEEITNKIEWDIDASSVVNKLGAGGDNLFNLSYIPRVRQGLKDAGYDAIKGQDILPNGNIETLVPLYPERLVPAYSNLEPNIRITNQPPSRIDDLEIASFDPNSHIAAHQRGGTHSSTHADLVNGLIDTIEPNDMIHGFYSPETPNLFYTREAADIAAKFPAKVSMEKHIDGLGSIGLAELRLPNVSDETLDALEPLFKKYDIPYVLAPEDNTAMFIESIQNEAALKMSPKDLVKFNRIIDPDTTIQKVADQLMLSEIPVLRASRIPTKVQKRIAAKKKARLRTNNAKPTKFYHGGSFDEGPIDLQKLSNSFGEPGNIRPLGLAFYGAEGKTGKAHASRYIQYGKNRGKLTEFDLQGDALIYPANNAAWLTHTLEEQEKFKQLSLKLNQKFRTAGYINEKGHWLDAVASSSLTRQQSKAIRQILLDEGIDGTRQIFDDLTELGIYNFKVLKK